MAGHDDRTTTQSRRRALGPFLREFPWIHLGIGMVGNLAFVVGSAMFFFKSLETAAIWVFVLASAGMLVGSLGQLLVRVERWRKGEDPVE